MSVKLVYHTESDSISPFDVRAIEIARNGNLRIACPYLSLEYLRRLIALSQSWQLLTDIEEWLGSLTTAARTAVCDFIAKNSISIRHVSGLHAKVLIGAKYALVGSANFTTSGIRCRTEMAVLLDDEAHLSELVHWFQDAWQKGHDVPINKLRQLAATLPEAPALRGSSLFENEEPRNAPLMVLDQERHVFSYQGARGYYTGSGSQFCVMKGSRARGTVSSAFVTNSNGKYNEIRDGLIGKGILSRSHESEEFEFTEDFVFDAPSPAACIVDGNARSGPKCWGPKPINRKPN